MGSVCSTHGRHEKCINVTNIAVMDTAFEIRKGGTKARKVHVSVLFNCLDAVSCVNKCNVA